MFGLSVAFLAVLSAIVVLWVDVPMMYEPLPEQAALAPGHAPSHPPAQAAEALLRTERALAAGHTCVLILGLLWIVFLVEFVFQYIVRDRERPFWRTHLSGLICCCCPPLRLCARNADMDGKIWLPGLRWRKVNASLRARLERILSVPMILIALTILPVLLIEFGMRNQVAENRWLQIALHVSLGVIWFAFAAEFIVMVSVADKKLQYCKGHWIDIAIILLPFVSFLRSLRIVRATRVARLARVEQLVRMSRLYRLRGLAMRALRAMLLLQLINRLLPADPEKQLKRLRTQLREKEADIRFLRRQIADLERRVATNQTAADAPDTPLAAVAAANKAATSTATAEGAKRVC
ncbi:MAG: potassium channel protein [Pirellulaceae bacterium]